MLKDATPVQRPVPGRAAGVRRRRVVRAAARGRALGRLPPVLHALPLPAAAAGVQGRALPAVAARLDRRHHARRRCAPCVVPRPLPQAASRPTSSCTRGSSAATRSRGRRGQGGAARQAGFSKELIVANVRRCASSSPRLDWDPPQGVWTGVRRAQHLHRRGRRAQGRLRPRGRPPRSRWQLVWDLGATTARYSRIAAEGARDVVAIDSDQAPSSCSTATLRDEGDERILPLTIEPRRPVAGPRLARARAQGRWSERGQARPGARAGARPPRVDHRQRAGQRSSSTGSRRSARRS